MGTSKKYLIKVVNRQSKEIPWTTDKNNQVKI